MKWFKNHQLIAIINIERYKEITIMIYTFTANPAIDYHIFSDSTISEQVNRVHKSYFELGGKGINVSKVLSQLGVPSVCLTFFDDMFWSMFRVAMEKYNLVTFRPVHIDGQIRENVKIHSDDLYEFNSEPKGVTEENIEELLSATERITKEDFLIVSGSGLHDYPDLYDQLVGRISKEKPNVIVDTPCKYYDKFWDVKPILLKPNIHELECYFKKKIKDEEIVNYAQKLIAKGAQNVLVSVGKFGSYFVCKSGAFRIKGIEKDYENTVGAGDSQVAGFISNYTITHDGLEAYEAAHEAALAFLEQDYKTTHKFEVEALS